MNWVSEEGYAETMRGTVEPALAKIRKDIRFPVRSGDLHVEVYEPEHAESGDLLLLHGFTESAEKFREMIWYFTTAGFRVVAPDQRGHGSSLRLNPDTSITDVDAFEDYVKDAEALLADPELFQKDRRSVLYGHSMGGAVAAFLLLSNPIRFSRAVLSSPMIAPSSAPLPKWAGSLVTNLFCLIGMGKARAFIGKPYDPDSETFEASFDTSRARFAYYAAKRRARPELQNTSPTYRWAKNAVGVTKPLLDAKALDRIETPVLLCQAGRETVVLVPEQDRFVSLLKHGEKERFESAKHEIYFSDDPVLHRYVARVIDFLREGNAGKAAS